MRVLIKLRSIYVYLRDEFITQIYLVSETREAIARYTFIERPYLQEKKKIFR